jgi:hypothetical protein
MLVVVVVPHTQRRLVWAVLVSVVPVAPVALPVLLLRQLTGARVAVAEVVAVTVAMVLLVL